MRYIVALALIALLVLNQSAEASKLGRLVRKGGAVCISIVKIPAAIVTGVGLAIGAEIFALCWHFDEIDREYGDVKKD